MTLAEAVAKFRAVLSECLEHDIVAIVMVAEEGPCEAMHVAHTLQTNAMASELVSGVAKTLGKSDA